MIIEIAAVCIHFFALSFELKHIAFRQEFAKIMISVGLSILVCIFVNIFLF